MLRWLHKTDKANRDTCKRWRACSHEKFVEHLRLLYPQLSNAADKSYLEMIKEIPFQYDLDNPVVELKSPKSSNITTLLPLRKKPRQKKLYWGKSISLMSIIGFPFSMRWPQAVMYQSWSSQ